MVDKIFTATKALLRYNNKFLILKESKKYADGTNAGRWVVPGGRVEPGQRFNESLLREIKEETNLDAKIINPIYVDEWRPVVRGEQWQIIGIFFLCEASDENVKLDQDHEEYQWISLDEIEDFDILPEDKAAFKELQKHL